MLLKNQQDLIKLKLRKLRVDKLHSICYNKEKTRGDINEEKKYNEDEKRMGK